MSADVFEANRQFLVGVAYRMLGSIAESEDIVQDAYLRWGGVDQASVDEPRAYLARIVTRLCLDRIKSARVRREEYVGTWLPEPVVHEVTAPAAEIADDVSVALLMTLDRLSPLERAAFLLHDVFDMDYEAIADVLERSTDACRQLAARGRAHVRDEQPRFERSREAETRLVGAFATAMMSGEMSALTQLLHDDAILYSDGGGKRLAALNPIYGADKIVRFFTGVMKKATAAQPDTARMVWINGLPGFVARSVDGVETIALETSGDRIVAIYIMRNPDKLRHLS